MLLRDNEGSEFELSIADYQFPNARDDWLLVDVRMKDRRGERRTRDPCLTVEEAGELAEWLDELAHTYSEIGIGPGMPDLIEPNLQILVLRTSPTEVHLRVEFLFESKGIDHVDLEMKRPDLERGVSDFRRELERYPAREPE